MKKLNKAESLVEDISQGLDVIEKQRGHLEKEIEQMIVESKDIIPEKEN